MEEDKEYKKIELRSEEVQEVMDRVPSWILRCGITILFGIILILLIGSYWFKYPDVITAEVTISTQEPPAYILARASGRLEQLYIVNGQKVKKDANLGVIENSANAQDVFTLWSTLQKWELCGYSLEEGERLFSLSGNVRQNLGEIQHVYASFISSLSESIHAKELGYYAKKMTSQEKQLSSQAMYYNQMKSQYDLAIKQQKLAYSTYSRDSILYSRDAMIAAEFEQSGTQYLQHLQSKESAQMSLTQTSIQIEQSKAALLDLKKQALEEEQRYRVNLKNATEQLIAQLTSWEQQYLLKSPVNGKVTFLSVWSQNQNVEAGKSIFVVAPDKMSMPVGQASLPLQGSGKVKPGQKVNVRLNNYPDQEFGYVTGKVISVSPVPTAEGMYVVDIAFPEGLRTNYGKELPMTQEMKGSAEIVTKDLRLIERLIMPLKKIWEQQQDTK